MDKDTFIPLIIGQVVLAAPFVYLSVVPKLKQMGHNLYEAALDLGASQRRYGEAEGRGSIYKFCFQTG